MMKETNNVWMMNEGEEEKAIVKNAYSTPALTVYGDVNKVTQLGIDIGLSTGIDVGL